MYPCSPDERSEIREQHRLLSIGLGLDCAQCGCAAHATLRSEPRRGHDTVHELEWTEGSTPAAQRGDCPADVPARALGAQARGVAGSGMRRGRTRTARRAGRRRCRHSRSRQRAPRPRRLEAAHAGAARGALRTHLRPRAGRGGDGAAGAHRSRQHPARVAVGSRQGGRFASGKAAARVRRWPRPHRCRLRVPGRHRRRRPRGVDRGGLDRRQGHA